MRSRARQGITLFESVAALTIVGLVAISALEAAGDRDEALKVQAEALRRAEAVHSPQVEAIRAHLQRLEAATPVRR